MDNVTLMRIVGLASTVVIFVITVILMPRIFGVNAPSAAPPDLPSSPPVPARAVVAEESQ